MNVIVVGLEADIPWYNYFDDCTFVEPKNKFNDPQGKSQNYSKPCFSLIQASNNIRQKFNYLEAYNALWNNITR